MISFYILIVNNSYLIRFWKKRKSTKNLQYVSFCYFVATNIIVFFNLKKHLMINFKTNKFSNIINNITSNFLICGNFVNY